MLRYLLPLNGLAPVAFLALLIQSPDPAHAAGVVTSLREAESFAIERDAGLAQIEATREALEERIVTSGQLPDPRLRFGALNLPVDSFELDQEPMTQLLVGLSQSFPPGRTLALRSASQASQAAAQAEMLAERRRMIRRQVRLLWTDIAQLQDAARIVERKQQWYRELEDAVTASYSSGARGQHDVVRARLERRLLGDRLLNLEGEVANRIAQLSRWTGAAPVDGMDIRIPLLPAPEDYETALQSIERHPLLRASASAVEVRELGEELARERYKPSFGVDVAYGFRSGEDASGDERPDFFSAMLNFSLPVLSGRRQDRELAAAQAERRAAREAEIDRRRELVAQLDSLWAGLTELEARDSLFQSDVLPDANTNVEATRAAYQNDYASFAELVGAQTLLLTQELSYLSLRADLARNRARLLYLTEEESQ
jgi:outer membrane protein TolC